MISQTKAHKDCEQVSPTSSVGHECKDGRVYCCWTALTGFQPTHKLQSKVSSKKTVQWNSSLSEAGPFEHTSCQLIEFFDQDFVLKVRFKNETSWINRVDVKWVKRKYEKLRPQLSENHYQFSDTEQSTSQVMCVALAWDVLSLFLRVIPQFCSKDPLPVWFLHIALLIIMVLYLCYQFEHTVRLMWSYILT